MRPTASNFGLETYGTLCDACGIPLDAEHFDRSAIRDVEWREFNAGDTLSLASFQLRPQYCAVVECFSQYTDRWARGQEVRTAGLRWSVRANGRPLWPYESVEHVVNPWGYGSFGVRIRVEEGAYLELAVTRVSEPGDLEGFTQIGGRICGRYWYNPAYGGRTESCR